ncbi:unnamed protein product [Ostreobium quekettii]|uniref:SET domain-containing protein n=1 Tax=Ostreobium quekettii TaxID=121088 RepID=A0A8S1J3F1_9CHLO|nr:unnamed protein product [Ostreobium quekettii]
MATFADQSLPGRLLRANSADVALAAARPRQPCAAPPRAAPLPRPSIHGHGHSARGHSTHSASATPAQISDLASWTQEASGAKAAVREEADGSSLVASGAISEGDEILAVPREMWVTAEDARRRWGPRLEGLEAWAQVALLLVAERGDGGSRWRAYLEGLPATPRSPVFWEGDRLAGLAGTQLMASCEGYREYFSQRFVELEAGVFKKYPELFPSNVFTLEAWKWAVGTVRAQVHPPLEGESLALVPVADLVCHSRNPNTEWRLSSGGFLSRGESLSLVAMRNISSEEVLSIDFGPDKLDSQVALDYGEVDVGTMKGGYVLTLTLPEDDPAFDDKIDILELAGFGQSATFKLCPNEPLSTDMLAFLRLMYISGADSFHLEALFRNEAWNHVLAPLSEENERTICDTMIAGCRDALGQYKTNPSSDRAILSRRGAAIEEVLAAQIRLGEQEGVRATLEQFEQRKFDLSKLDYYAERRLRDLGLLDEEGKSTYDGFMEDGIA